MVEAWTSILRDLSLVVVGVAVAFIIMFSTGNCWQAPVPKGTLVCYWTGFWPH